MQKELFYDVVVIGGGIGGLMAAYGLKTNHAALKVAILEQGPFLEKRVCPASATQGCLHCRQCAITSGYAGAGAFSDGKFNLGTAYGGTLGEELGNECAMEYIKKLDKTLKRHAPKTTDINIDYPKIYQSNTKLKQKCSENNLQLLDMNVRHLGTDRNLKIMHNIIDYLLIDLRVDLYANCKVLKLNNAPNNCAYKSAKYQLITNDENNYYAEKVVIATGRGGADFVEEVCKTFKIQKETTAVDIGFRVEMKDYIWKEFSSKIYEPKIIYHTTARNNNKCRMFCFNQGGLVSAENNHGIITANGHSYADVQKKTDNCNFAILNSLTFTEPFDNPTAYAENFSKLANLLGGGNVIVQRFGDLIRKKRTNKIRLENNSVKPTLKATPGDFRYILPDHILDNIIETIYALDRVAPGTADDDTLLYGCESKYYSIKPKHNQNFEIAEGLYLIGDGSGITRGLSQAGAQGLYVADKIVYC